MVSQLPGTYRDKEKAECKQITERLSGFMAERSTTENTWQECFQFIVPRKADITSQRTPGEKRGSELFDTTAITANSLLAATLHSYLTNLSSYFFELFVGDEALDNDDEVIRWLQEVTHILHVILNNSNFQTEIHEHYLDQACIGTSCLYVGEHDQNIVHFSARNMKEIYVDENNLGLIDTVYRVFQWTLRQMVQEFGESALPADLARKYYAGCVDKFTIVNAVEPLQEKGYFGFSSRYILKEESYILARKNYREQPYLVPRWTKTSGEKYGRGPGMDMLPDIKMVNAMMETTLKGGQLTTLPPLIVKHEGILGRARLTPAGMTVVDASMDEVIKPLITDARVDYGQQLIEDVRRRIKAGFYTDKIQLNDGPMKTAYEVSQIVEEGLRYMGPVLGRQHLEFLRPMVARVYGIAYRRGKIPPPPAKLKNRAFDVRYSSLVAKAQRMSEVNNISRAITAAAPIFNAFPNALDIVNADASAKYILQTAGFPQKLFNDQRQMKQLRDARAAAEEQKASEMQQTHQAELAQKVGPTLVQLNQNPKQGA